MGDADHRLAAPAEAEGLVGVGRRRPGHGVGLLLPVGLLGRVDALHVSSSSGRARRQTVRIRPRSPPWLPSRTARSGRDVGALRPCRAWPRRGASHHEGAAGDRHHLKLDVGAGDGFDVGLHRGRRLRRRFLRCGPRVWRSRGPAPRGPRRNARHARRRLTFGMLQVARRGPCRRVRSWPHLVRVAEGIMGMTCSRVVAHAARCSPGRCRGRARARKPRAFRVRRDAHGEPIQDCFILHRPGNR